MGKTLKVLLLIGISILAIKFGEIGWRYVDRGYGKQVKIDSWNKRMEEFKATEFSQIGRLLNINNQVTELQKNKMEELILDSLLLRGYYADQPEPSSDTSSYHPINAYYLKRDKWLIISEYGNSFGEFGLCGQIAVINLEEYDVCIEEIVPGGKYYPPEVSFLDVDNDGDKEILCQLIYPTSSVPVIEYIDMVFELNVEACELVQSLIITTESVDCASRHLRNENASNDLGDLVYRQYTFETPLKLEVLEEDYLFVCDEFRDSVKTTKELVDRTIIQFVRSEKGGKFE